MEEIPSFCRYAIVMEQQREHQREPIFTNVVNLMSTTMRIMKRMRRISNNL